MDTEGQLCQKSDDYAKQTCSRFSSALFGKILDSYEDVMLHWPVVHPWMLGLIRA